MSSYFAHETAVIDEGTFIGEACKIWHFSHVMKGARLGEGCNVGQNVVISPDVVLGRNVKVQNNVSIYTGVVCEDNVFLGPSMVFTNILIPRSEFVRRDEYISTLVKEGASIGANATLVCGIELGRYCMIGAGAVVHRNVLDFALMVGNPARQIGWVSRAGHTLEFDESGLAICPETLEQYMLKEDHLLLLQ
jgi:UDP-2-acetamido-3-amino-2,3-dideoxy-glucuronate N-acetyltransferase